MSRAIMLAWPVAALLASGCWLGSEHGNAEDTGTDGDAVVIERRGGSRRAFSSPRR